MAVNYLSDFFLHLHVAACKAKQGTTPISCKNVHASYVQQLLCKNCDFNSNFLCLPRTNKYSWLIWKLSPFLISNSFWNHRPNRTFVLALVLLEEAFFEEDSLGCFSNLISFHACLSLHLLLQKLQSHWTMAVVANTRSYHTAHAQKQVQPWPFWDFYSAFVQQVQSWPSERLKLANKQIKIRKGLKKLLISIGHYKTCATSQ